VGHGALDMLQDSLKHEDPGTAQLMLQAVTDVVAAAQPLKGGCLRVPCWLRAGSGARHDLVAQQALLM
jgi:hypothetical protein